MTLAKIQKNKKSFGDEWLYYTHDEYNKTGEQIGTEDSWGTAAMARCV